MSRRAFVIVLDACGAGATPDAADYGDEGTSTLQHVAQQAGGLSLPTLQELGLGNILPLEGVTPAPDPVVHGRLHPEGFGKDTTTGHWELMGVIQRAPPPTFPEGFPDETLERIETLTNGRGVLCNRPYDGVEVIGDFGEEHLRTGDVIVYTSQDSVLQIAAHEDVLSCADLHELCARLRDHERVSRVIARPFVGRPGAFERTSGRRDFALPPPSRSYVDALHARGVPVHGVGKAAQVFAGRGFDHQHPGPDNDRALRVTTELVHSVGHGFVFTNLVDTDQIHGHRKDVHGFHAALQQIDRTVASWLPHLRDDLLVLCADHGVDPLAPGFDHTREHAPLLAAFPGQDGRRHDGPLADVGASVYRWLTGKDLHDLPGTAFTP